MTDHTDLIRGLEEAEAGSASLDREIARAFGWHRVEPRHARNKHGGWIAPEDFMGVYSDGSPVLDSLRGTSIWRDPPTFTTSLDAALALAERLGMDQWHVAYAAMMDWRAHIEGRSLREHLPRLVVIATLRALQKGSDQ